MQNCFLFRHYTNDMLDDWESVNHQQNGHNAHGHMSLSVDIIPIRNSWSECVQFCTLFALLHQLLTVDHQEFEFKIEILLTCLSQQPYSNDKLEIFELRNWHKICLRLSKWIGVLSMCIMRQKHRCKKEPRVLWCSILRMVMIEFYQTILNAIFFMALTMFCRLDSSHFAYTFRQQ